MAGEPIPAEPIVPAAAPETPAPAIEAAPVVAPVAEPVIEAKPEAALEVPHPADVPTMLEKLGQKPVEAKSEDAKPGDKPIEAKPAEAKPGEPVVPALAPEPVEYKFEFPDTIKPDEAKVSAFTDLAREARMSPEQAQKAVGMFNDAATAYREEVSRNQFKAFNDTRMDWEKQVMADPVLGGAGHMTAMGAVARVRDRLTSDSNPGTPQYEADQKSLNDFLRITGAGSHPVFMRMLHRASAFIDEPSAPAAQAVPTKTNGVRSGRSLYRNSPPATR